MSQLELQIIPKLPYVPEYFLLHSGVSQFYDVLISSAQSDEFRSFYVLGGSRSGKTHLSLKLVDVLSRNGSYPRLIEGSYFGSWLSSGGVLQLSDSDEVLILDDADQYLRTIFPGKSGPFVDCFEHCRLRRIPIVLLSKDSVDELPCDDHVMSRLRSSMSFSLDSPQREELSLLLQLMAKQRGLALGERKIEFLSKRLPSELLEIEAYLERLLHLRHTFGRDLDFTTLADAL